MPRYRTSQWRVTDNTALGRGAERAHEVAVLRHAALDRRLLAPGPFDGPHQAVAQWHLRGEAQPVARFRGIAEALSRAIPIARRRERNRRGIAAELVHQLRQLADRRLASRGEIVDLARLAFCRAGDEAAADVVDI